MAEKNTKLKVGAIGRCQPGILCILLKEHQNNPLPELEEMEELLKERSLCDWQYGIEKASEVFQKIIINNK